MVELYFKGDKSLSHRAAIFACLADGKSAIENFLTAEDTLNTLYAFESLGVKIRQKNGTIIIESAGLATFRNKSLQLNLGNSGTGARLLLGLFSGLENVQVIIDR
eukprot:UN05656